VTECRAGVLRSSTKQRLDDVIPPDTLRELVEARILDHISPDGRDCVSAVKTARRLASRVIAALRGGERRASNRVTTQYAAGGSRPPRQPQ
jgi:hypothetical protein